HSIERFKKLVYIPPLDKFIFYGDKIITIGKDSALTNIDETMLRAAGITRVEQILFDELYDNIFIRDLRKLFVFNLHTGKFKRLFQRMNFEQSQIALHNNTLIIGSKNGIIFTRITGRGRLSQPIHYPNTKAMAYKNLRDIVPSRDEVLLNTDSGLLAVTIPTKYSDLQDTQTASRYILLLKDGEKLNTITTGDTIYLNTTNNKIQFDLVNPNGVGRLRFQSFIAGIDSGYIELRSDELQSGNIPPGKHYQMTLRAQDDIWVSPDINFVLYKIPTFWQTTMGTALFWSLLITGLGLVVFSIIYYTRKIVSAKHLKKNYLLSLELKAIHAQINPHFIFNTLNTGLYFISENKNEEAYEHISSFSELLRSYIKSSRSKYVTLGEEIDNLENYIALQQSRFENKFSFAIRADEGINTDTTLIPSLLLQPFVENAINHGLLHKESRGHLSVNFISENPEKEIICIIDDDGVGRAKSAQINRGNPNKPRSYGNELIGDLTKLINTDGHLNVHIEYKDKTAPQTGTTVIITIKKVHHDK
ncbi:MAG TPA: histidine kinase, partial [Flavipsychrobacter sp.]|nr:histidine kinase [Flavipsychrobacter sp.]